MIDPSSWDSHQLAAATEKKNEKFRSAFGISSDYVGGSAFDDTLKAMKAEEAAAKKEEGENKYAPLFCFKFYSYICRKQEELLLQQAKNKRGREESTSEDRYVIRLCRVNILGLSQISGLESSSQEEENSDSSSSESEDQRRKRKRRKEAKSSKHAKHRSVVC